VKFLADENFPIDSVTVLREAGYDVESIQESFPSLSDVDILARAVTSGRILITFDRDFGDLIFNRHLAAPIGVVYFRILALSSLEPASLLIELLQHHAVEGKFTRVGRREIRQRSLQQ
jgi:predicted nuclease of predicted toxin-antitoxin system